MNNFYLVNEYITNFLQCCLMMQTSINCILLGAIFSTVFCRNGYYWRDWDGTIPSDAYIAANDSGEPVYFAQAYVYQTGLYVGNIEKHQNSIAVNPSTYTGPVKYSNILKIFCSSSESLMWLPTNASLTPKLATFIQPVIGGITDKNATVYVGRNVINGRTFIGSIHTDNYLYYTNCTGGGAYNNNYEILIHEIESGC